MARSKSRADRFADAQASISEVKERVEELRDELQNWRDNLPENLQSGSKADQLDECICELESVIDNLDQAENSSPEFPGMIG